MKRVHVLNFLFNPKIFFNLELFVVAFRNLHSGFHRSWVVSAEALRMTKLEEQLGILRETSRRDFVEVRVEVKGIKTNMRVNVREEMEVGTVNIKNAILVELKPLLLNLMNNKGKETYVRDGEMAGNENRGIFAYAK
ncbi:hypothetical protein GH714_014285 [Hevea brasiliensis]|uniref:Uncharacterized protein n=1 Tax=Hevea brasiliensis TaxID=3981 RepID=A0A6A6MTH4_HEVBR|nr:hypothetical protein GH714_014285 [Hevea brasiliensis]